MNLYCMAKIMSYTAPKNGVGVAELVMKSDKALATKSFQLPEDNARLAGIVARGGIWLDITVLERTWIAVLDDIIASGEAVPLPEAFFE